MKKKEAARFKPVHVFRSDKNLGLPRENQFVLVDNSEEGEMKIFWPVIGKFNIKDMKLKGATIEEWQGYLYVELDWYKDYLRKSYRVIDKDILSLLLDTSEMQKLIKSILSGEKKDEI